MGKEYVVIGLGRFGGSIVRELHALDMDVMAIDHDENRVNEYSDIATHAVVAYNVSGEYSMTKAAAQTGWIDEERVV
ncbi:NAD-binding protein, partial [Staphylococcus aureus]|uniref:NAD-binding protein n=1 Tax=Staphylococcus aureus TaxID=1280 RepID=UPI00210B9955